MIYKYKMQGAWLVGLLCLYFSQSSAQSSIISLEEAIAIAQKNNAGLERDRLAIMQQNKLAEAGLPQDAAQLYITGEEFGAGNQSGIHALNAFQNFNLPKANRTQKSYYQKGALLATQKMKLTDQALKRQVKQAYYALLFAKAEQTLQADNKALYQNFLTVTTAQLAAGETGKIPQLAARNRLGQAQLTQQIATEKYQTALDLFNQWLQAETQYDVAGDLPEVDIIMNEVDIQNSSHLQFIQAQRELAITKIEVEEAKLLPQINTGLKLMTANDNFPLFGYQLGVNMPLFKKAYTKRIEAAEVGVKAQEAALKSRQQSLNRKISTLQNRLATQRNILQYIQADLEPLLQEQNSLNLTAFREGQVSYLEYMDGLEQVVKVRMQYLQALYQYHFLKTEMEYWAGI